MGTRLRETRLKYGKKQPEVAEVLGIGVPAYSMMESGQREDQLVEAHKACRVLRMFGR